MAATTLTTEDFAEILRDLKLAQRGHDSLGRAYTTLPYKQALKTKEAQARLWARHLPRLLDHIEATHNQTTVVNVAPAPEHRPFLALALWAMTYHCNGENGFNAWTFPDFEGDQGFICTKNLRGVEALPGTGWEPDERDGALPHEYQIPQEALHQQWREAREFLARCVNG